MSRQEQVAATIEAFVRKTFLIDGDDPEFSRTCDLFEEGFVDSMGLVKLLSFIEKEFGVTVEEEHLFDERFPTIQGESELIVELMGSTG